MGNWIWMLSTLVAGIIALPLGVAMLGLAVVIIDFLKIETSERSAGWVVAVAYSLAIVPYIVGALIIGLIAGTQQNFFLVLAGELVVFCIICGLFVLWFLFLLRGSGNLDQLNTYQDAFLEK